MPANFTEVVPKDADPEEATAIVVAISAYLQEKGPKDEETFSWQGNRWQFAGRMETLLQRTSRIPARAPTDAWTASGRADRMS